MDPRRNRQTLPPAPSSGYSPANGTGSTMTGQGEDMRPEPIRRKGRKTLAKVYDSLSDPEKAPDRSRIIGLPTKKEARDIRDELTAAAWAGGKSVSRIRTAKEYISCLCSISCCGFSHDDFSGLGRACRPRNGLNWMVLVSPPERTGKDYDQHAPSTVYPSFAAERGIRRVDRAENTCQRADGA